jgi:hypothetical protein
MRRAAGNLIAADERTTVVLDWATLALTGASRVHWMLSRGIEPPPGYVEFVVAEAC